MGSDAGSTDVGRPSALLIETGGPPIWGITSSERLRRSLARAGVDDVRSERGADIPTTPTVFLRTDWIFDQRLIEALVRADDTVLCADDGSAVAAHAKGPLLPLARALVGRAGSPDPGLLAVETSDSLAGSYENKLRKREPAFLMPLDAETLPAIRERTFRGSYKGVTDIVTKRVWPRPARIVTRWCAEIGITPNQVTWASFALVILAFWLFWTGAFAAGLVAAWVMTFLDTVDGKLARVTLNYSKAGDVLDHGIDLVHPPFWWWAWIVGLGAVGMSPVHPGWTLAAIVVGYVAQRLEEGAFLGLLGIEMHVWRPFDSRFREITARRNPNLVILTVGAIAGRPDWAITVVAVWTVACFLVHLVRLLQALAARRNGPVTSWLAG